MIKSLLKPLLTLFWPVGLTEPLTDEGQKDLKGCIKHWKNNEHAEPSANPRDVEIQNKTGKQLALTSSAMPFVGG